MVPAARPPLSPKQREEAFDNYLHLIYGSELMKVGVQSVPGSAMTFTLSEPSFLFFPVPGWKF